MRLQRMPVFMLSKLGPTSAWLMAIACIVLCGCGPKRPELVPVTGTVVYQGQPVAEAQVTFMPVGARPANGQTDAEGKFQLTTYEKNDGAVPGEHSVTVSKMVDTGKKQNSYAVMESALPEKYQSPKLSGITQKVSAEGPNDFRIELK